MLNRHPSESWDLPSCYALKKNEIPAFAGMTALDKTQAIGR
jgi:hypothetical protein